MTRAAYGGFCVLAGCLAMTGAWTAGASFGDAFAIGVVIFNAVGVAGIVWAELLGGNWERD